MQQPQTDVFRDGYHTSVRHEVLGSVPKQGGTLLDVGGGVGATAAKLKDMGVVSRAGVVDLIRPENAPVDFFHVGNLEDPEVIDRVIKAEGPFSTILCLDVLEHLVDPWRVIADLHRGLAPNGVIVASIPNVRCLEVLYPLLFRNSWALKDSGLLDRTHLRFFVRQTAIELMTSSGLVLESVKPLPHPAKKYQRLRKVALGLADSFTDLQYLIVVRNRATDNGSI